MCQRCDDAVKSAVKNGVSDEDVMEFLWNETAFPCEPSDEQLDRLSKLTPEYFVHPVIP